MPQFETSMGGPGGRFPETAWSSILNERDPASPGRREKLDDLCRRYWRPVYTYVRRTSWGRTPDDAKDLTQAFFAHVLESDVVARFEPGRGRFRSFLKGVLSLFLTREHRDRHRLKRDGGVIISLDVAPLESAGAADGSATPEEQFDRQWVREVVTRAVDRLRDHFSKEGKGLYFSVYERYELAGGQAGYDDVARDLGISVSDVQNYLRLARERLQQFIVEDVRDYVTSADELADEINELFS